jgi:hypothetical protein
VTRLVGLGIRPSDIGVVTLFKAHARAVENALESSPSLDGDAFEKKRATTLKRRRRRFRFATLSSPKKKHLLLGVFRLRVPVFQISTHFAERRR